MAVSARALALALCMTAACGQPAGHHHPTALDLRLSAKRECMHPTESSAWPPSDGWMTEIGVRYAYDLVVTILSVRSNTVQHDVLLSSVALPGQRCSVLFVLVYADKALALPEHTWVDTHVLALTVNTDETYGNLPTKVLTAFAWVSEHVHFKYLLKTDDDAYVCVGGLLALLSKLPRKSSYWGKLRRGGQAVMVDGKWRDDGFSKLLKSPAYGVYAFGAGYVLSADLVRLSVWRMLGIAPACSVEDGLIGASILGVSPVSRMSIPPSESWSYFTFDNWEPANTFSPRVPTLFPAGGSDADGFPPIAVLPTQFWMPSASTALFRRGEDGTPPLAAALPLSSEVGYWEGRGESALERAQQVVYLSNTTRIQDIDSKTAAQHLLGIEGIRQLCVRTLKLPPPPFGAPRRAPPPFVAPRRAPSATVQHRDHHSADMQEQRVAQRSAKEKRRYAEKERLHKKGKATKRHGHRRGLAGPTDGYNWAEGKTRQTIGEPTTNGSIAKGWAAERGDTRLLRARRLEEAEFEVASERIAWRSKKKGDMPTRTSFKGYFLIIHRITPHLIKHCANIAGAFCTQY